MTDRNFTPRLGQGDLPDLFDYAVVSQGDFERAVSVWDGQMDDYKGLLLSEYVGERVGLYTAINNGVWRWLERSHRYRNRQTGEVVNDAKWVELRDAFTDAMHTPVILVTDEMMDREITLHEWLRRMAVMIRDTHLAMYMLGAGGYNAIDQTAVITLESTLREQFDHLRDFGQEIMRRNRGRVRQHISLYTTESMKRRGVINRSVLYIESATASAERGRTTTYGRLPGELPHYPGDGSTICRTRCRCHWRFNVNVPGGGGSVIHAFWRLRARDRRNCQTCLTYAQLYNPFRLLTF